MSRLFYSIAALLWASVIFLLSSFPDLATDLSSTADLILRKGAHIMEFVILALLIHKALGFRNKLWPTLVIGILYAASDEWHQSFVQGRNGNFVDLGIDTLGVLLGTFLAGRTEKSPWQE
ncbi:MAG: VanZ family protein [Patescibacteria group bacterium]|jgi:VanZ family protein